jgi:uncharacterized membrane protein
MIENIIIVAAGTLTTLLAGIFFAFTVAINGALHRLKDAEYVRAMDSINFVIERNGLFLLTFMLPIVLLPLAAFMVKGEADNLPFYLLLGASAFYIFGTFGVTMGKNVPMNKELEKFNASANESSDYAGARKRYEQRWNNLHNFRTFMGIIASVLAFAACLSLR